MKKRRVFFVLLLAVFISFALLWLRRGSGVGQKQISNVAQAPAAVSPSFAIAMVSPSPTIALPPGVAAKLSEPGKRNVAKLVQAFGAPIEFYGKIVDERGVSVSGGKVHYSAADQYFGDSSKYEGVSDENGLFFIRGINGADLYVNVAKDGYYGTIESGAAFGYGVPSGKRPPSKENPAIFVLRKMGEAVPIVRVLERPVKVPKNGMPVEIALKTGRTVSTGQGEVRIECWTEDENKDAQGRYPWRCRVTAPGGGLVKREGEFSFEAPIEGYQPFDDIIPSTERWSSGAEREYFVKTADNHFARVSLRMRTGGEHFIVVESYFNPQSGSRNLEYDPTKQTSTR